MKSYTRIAAMRIDQVESISIRYYHNGAPESLLGQQFLHNPPQTCHHKMHAASKGVEPRNKPIIHGLGTNVALAPEDEEPAVDDADAVAAEPRLKVGEGRVVSVAMAVVAPAGGAVTAAPLSERISVAVELT